MKTKIEFLRLTADRFAEAFDRTLKAVDQLDDQQIWFRPSSQSNSVGIILQHLIGNLNQWVRSGIGEVEFHRNRPEEFKDFQHPTKDDIREKFSKLGKQIQQVISQVSPDSLHSPKQIQNTDVTVMSAFYKAITHCEFHEGQILYIAKLILNEKYIDVWEPKK